MCSSDLGRYVFVSENFERLGTPMDEWLGRTDADLWPADVADGFRRNDVAVLGGSGSIEVVEEAIARDGSRSWWLNHKFLFVDATGRRYVGGLGVDVTARVMAEEQLRQAHDELDRRVKERTAELASANASLQQQIEERERMDQARLDLLARLVFAQEDERRQIGRAHV